MGSSVEFSAMTNQGPTVFNGRYELHRQLARGGMADVFLARRAEADAWVVKPVDPLALRRTAQDALAG